jgi:hypothetical protein
MRRQNVLSRFVFVLLSMSGLFFPAVGQAEEPMSNFNFLVGKRSLDKTDWEPVETQTSIGFGQ